MSDPNAASGYPASPEPLPVAVYDNHTHLEFDPGYPGLDLTEHLDRATAVGVAGVVQVGTDPASSRWSAAAAERNSRVLASVAVHPNEAAEYAAQGILDDALAEIDRLAALPRVVAVGETGLDYYRTESAAGRAAQLRSFEAHIEIAKQHGLALQIHDREAHDDVIATLLRVGAPDRTVFHCFSGDAAMAGLCAEHGWYLSFAGNLTFKNAQNLRDALAVAPASRLLVETDAPFLTPVPLRGRPNAPYLIPHTVRAMAAVRGVEVADLATQLAANAVAVNGRWS